MKADAETWVREAGGRIDRGEEPRRARATPDTQYHADVAHCKVCTAMRLDEIVRIEWQHLDPRLRTIPA